MTVQAVLDYLWQLAPAEYQMSWDNIGFLLGRKDANVTRVLVALDADAAVADEAQTLGCQLVVTHHPILFHAAKHLTDADPMTETALTFLERGIAVISMHTNLDCAPGGVNDALARTLGLQNVAVLPDGETAGLIRVGELASMPLIEFADLVRQRLQCPGLRYLNAQKPVRRVAVGGGGGCASYIKLAADAGCDTFVTADVKYHEFQQARVFGLNLIDAGHFETEHPVCEVLREKLSAQFPELAVYRSAAVGCIRFLSR